MVRVIATQRVERGTQIIEPGKDIYANSHAQAAALVAAGMAKWPPEPAAAKPAKPAASDGEAAQ